MSDKTTREWISSEYDEALRLVALPLKESPWLALYLRVMAEAAEVRPEHIMDLGCGTGRFARIVDCCGFGDGYHGVDFSNKRIFMAREYAPGLKFTCGDIFDTGIRDTFPVYDMFTLIEILEHLHEDRKILSFIPEGKTIVASVPNYTGPGSGHVRCFKTEADVLKRYEGIVDINRISCHHISHTKKFFIFRGVRVCK